MSEFEVRVEVKARAGPFPTGPKTGRITVVLCPSKALYNAGQCHVELFLRMMSHFALWPCSVR